MRTTSKSDEFWGFSRIQPTRAMATVPAGPHEKPQAAKDPRASVIREMQEFFAEFILSEANGLRMTARRAFQHPDSGRAMLWAKVCLWVGVLIAVSACAPGAAAQITATMVVDNEWTCFGNPVAAQARVLAEYFSYVYSQGLIPLSVAPVDATVPPGPTTLSLTVQLPPLPTSGYVSGQVSVHFPFSSCPLYGEGGGYAILESLQVTSNAGSVNFASVLPTNLNQQSSFGWNIPVDFSPGGTGGGSGSVSGADLGPCKQCQGQAGAPINVTNGNVWVQQQDYTLPGLGGGLALPRTWNSLLGSAVPPNLVGMFGQAWRSTYEEMLAGPDSNNNLKYWRGDGSAWTFTYNTSLNSYSLTSPPDERAQLVSNPAGGFILTLADGTQRVFTSQDLLAAIIDRNGNQTTLAYDNSNRLTSVTSPGGGRLSFTYGDSNNPVQATTVQDSLGTVATYTYDSSARLTLVSYSDGSALNFTYDPNSSMILSITDSQGKVLETHTYDSQNRGLTSSRAYGVDSVTVSY